MPVVYWLHEWGCEESWYTHGYIGVTNNLVLRIRNHRNSGQFIDGFLVSILFEGTTKECLDVEKRVRPNKNIGWNRMVGGWPSDPSRPKPIEWRKSRSKATKGSGNGFFGKKHTQETRELYSQQLMGNTRRLGHKHSDETKKKMSKAHMGNQNWKKRKPYSKEALAKMSAASKKRWDKHRKELEHAN